MKKVNFFFHTLGCKVNQYETQAIREHLSALGHTCDTALPIDAIVINSCTVTAESDRKTRQLLRRLRRENPSAVIVLTGCMVQAFPDAAAALNEADIVVGNTDVLKTVSLIEEYIKNPSRAVVVTPHQTGEEYCTPAINEFSERTRAFIKIEDGCNRFCSYCIIPYARGRVRSRSLDGIKAEAVSLAENGFKEIVLTGINLSAYGMKEDFNLCDAVDTVCGVEGIKRVRLGSLEPDHITDGMLARFAAQEKFCPQFHLSLQSGCDDTLRRMNRHYDSAFYMDLVTRIRAVFPDAAITTDIMVGFAGEDEREFGESLNFVKRVGFARAHIFAYSVREGTAATRFQNQVTNAQKEKRARMMSDAVKNSETEFLKKQCLKTHNVLFEEHKNGIAEGYTANYTRVQVKTDRTLNGMIIPVHITDVIGDCCVGKLI